VLAEHGPNVNGRGPDPARPEFACIPSRGDRIELLQPQLGVRQQGRVFYADQLQVLVKWDDGRSQSLRAGAQVFRIVADEPAST
jgi:hypothetical protein